MRETRTLEYKETVSNTFLKTVSAYANYGTGEIKFGINDNGTIIGVKDAEKVCLDIENRINDSIDPVPEYTLHVNERSSVITLTVKEGLYKPYFYKSKAYRRNDSATIEVDRLELTRLVLEGQNLSFEELQAKNQNLNFDILEGKMKSILNIQTMSLDILKTLDLFRDSDGYNNAGALLADKNNFPGIDIVRFGDSISVMLDRETFEHVSLLKQYDQALSMYRKYYQYEEIKGPLREKVEIIPEEAFREAIANALVHRTWDVNSHIRISMYEDRIEIISPGDLPKGISEAEYLNGGISMLRNPIIGNVFFRLHIIEQFGTGIKRINDAYRESEKKPVYEITENAIKTVLPVFQKHTSLNEDEKKIYKILKGKSMSSSAIAEVAGFGKTKAVSILKKMTAEGYIKSSGAGRGTKYSLL